ncbi:spindle assembly abnormal protein 6 homolog [Arctopsyche grandis]|uniref:spindle assembly abnormal protein 6 homolog n=1 Tax=Arctopsyche grandis TaxID=121162 RepID=UPI00406D8844
MYMCYVERQFCCAVFRKLLTVVEMRPDFCGTSGPPALTPLYSGVHSVRLRGTVEQLRNLTLTITITNTHGDSKMKVVLSDASDPSFLCVLIIAPTDYDDIKKTQGLLVDFDDFPTQFIRLLQQCDSGNMFLSLFQQGPSNIYLEIVERNDFKRLVHLSLKTVPASDADIKKNMAENILLLQKNLANVTSTLSSKEAMFLEKEKFLEMRVNDLNNSLSQLNEEKLQRENEFQDLFKRERDRLEREKQEWKKCAELNSKNLNDTLQETISRKERQLEDITSRSRQLQDTITSLESQIIDKSQRVLTLEKQLHTARSDADTWRNQNGTLDRKYQEKDQNLQQTRTRLSDTEKALNDKSNMLRDALDSLQTLKREKTNFEEKANHHEALSNKRSIELQNINEDLLKANQIIAKQNKDILESREKLMCRTALVYELEKVIERNSDSKNQFEEKETKLFIEIEKHEKTIEKLQSELESHKQAVEEKGEIIKNNNAVIQWLHKKVDAVQSVNDLVSSVSSRVTPSTHTTTHFTVPHLVIEDDESPREGHRLSNIYSAGLTRGSASDKGIQSARHQREFDHDQFSLDPVYLQPSGQTTTRTSNRTKSQDSLTKGILEAPKGSKTMGGKNNKPTDQKKTRNDRLTPLPPAVSAYFRK